MILDQLDMEKACIILTFAFALAFSLCATLFARDKQVQTISQIHLRTPEGGMADLRNTATTKATVFVLLAPECPISQQCTKELNELAKQYAKSGIRFYGVFPGDYYTAAEITTFKNQYSLGFTLLLDPAYQLTRLLQGSITPEVFVIGSDNSLLYSGAADNAYKELGKKNALTTEHYLADALAAIVNGLPIAKKHVDAVGCLVDTKNTSLHE